jgi:hypothetical protein
MQQRIEDNSSLVHSLLLPLSEGGEWVDFQNDHNVHPTETGYNSRTDKETH